MSGMLGDDGADAKLDGTSTAANTDGDGTSSSSSLRFDRTLEADPPNDGDADVRRTRCDPLEIIPLRPLESNDAL